jgi:ABC-type transport system substrate-binding protein
MVEGSAMKGRNRIRAVGSVALAAVSVVVLAACGAKSNEPASTTSPTVSPTSKITLPGPNNFSPSPIAPLNPTASPGSQVAPRP